MTTEQILLFGSGFDAAHVNAGEFSYFSIQQDGSLGGLWRSDGTESGTIQLTSLDNPSDSLPNIERPSYTEIDSDFDSIGLDGQYFFAGTEIFTLSFGRELYISNGTPEGTKLLKDINPSSGDSFPEDFRNLNGTILFTASVVNEDSNSLSGEERKLWRTDGTSEGTQILLDIPPFGGGSSPFRGFADEEVNGNLFFTAIDSEGITGLWKTDGTTEGTQLIKSFESVVPGESLGNISFLDGAGNNQFFIIENSLWRSDGTEAGTQFITEIGTSNYYLPESIGIGNNFYFTTAEPTSELLWVIDGATEDPQIIDEGGFGDLTELNGKLYFSKGDKDSNVISLSTIDDTTESRVIKNFEFQPIGDFTKVNETLFFSNFETEDIWSSDGTESGTTVAVEGANLEDPSIVSSDENHLYYRADITIQGEDTRALFSLSVPDNTDDNTDDTDNPSEPTNTIELFRFRNVTFDSGTYVFVGEGERDNIRDNQDFSNTFSLDGEQEDGTINAAFTASLEPGEDLIPFYRLSSLDVPGTFLFVSTGEYDNIFADDSNQRDKWEKQGLDDNGEDVAEFYLLDGSADRGVEFNRFQNTQNGTFLYAGPSETQAIESDPNLSEIFVNQGVAFESL